MNPASLLPFLLASCQAPADAGSTGPAATAAGSIVRLYDLSGLSVVSEEPTSEPLWPTYLLPFEHDESYAVPDVDRSFGMELLQNCLSTEFQSEGVSTYFDEPSSRLVVSAPAPVHERVERVLPRLAGILEQSADYELDRIRVEGALISEAAGGLIPEAEARTMVDAAERAGKLQRLRLSVPPGRPSRVADERRVSLHLDYDVEVAEASGIYDEVGLTLALGARVTLRTSPGRGGEWVALVVRQAEAGGPVRERRVGRLQRFTYEQASREEREELLTMTVPTEDRSYALNTYLPDGFALAVASSVGAPAKGQLLILRRIGPANPAQQRVELGAGRVLTVCQNAAVRPPVVRVLVDDDLESMWTPGQDFYNALVASTEGPDGDLGVESLLLLSQHGEADIQSTSCSHWTALWPNEAGASLPDVEGLVASCQEPVGGPVLRVTLRRAAGSAVVAACTLPLRAGVESVACVGIEDARVSGFDVEIAHRVATEDPKVSRLFDGFVLGIEPHLRSDGAWSLALDGMAEARSGDLRTVRLGSSGVGDVEDIDVDRLRVRQNVVLRPQEANRAAIGGNNLVLEVELVR